MENEENYREALPSSSWDLQDNKELLLMKLASERASLNRQIMYDSYSDEDEDEEMEFDEDEVLQKRSMQEDVSNAVGAALERVQNYTRNGDFLAQTSQPVSERGSLQSTIFHASSLPESIDGGFAEVDDLVNLPSGPEKTLKINHALQRRFSSILSNLHNALKENQTRQVELRKNLRHLRERDAEQRCTSKNRDQYQVKSSNFAIPFFKDRSGMSAPMNRETKDKIEAGYLDLYTTRISPWCRDDSNILLKTIANVFKNQAVATLIRDKEDLERTMNNYDEPALEAKETKLEALKNKIRFLSNLPEDKMEIPSDAKIDWDEVSAQAFDGYRSPEECCLHWKNYFNSEINKDAWTQEEDIRIQELVSEAGESKPKWEEIAKELGTKRRGYQVLQRYASFIRPALHPANWNAENSKLLVDTITRLRIGNYIPWFQVTQCLAGYTTQQLRSRWKALNPGIVRGQFTLEEDFVLVKGLFMFGLNWGLICHFIQGRIKGQVRDRFRRGILPGLTYKPWKGSEDRKIIENCSSGQKFWRKLKLMFPNRDIPEIRLRFSTLQFWQTISKQISKPPPLFPLSSTTNSEEINRIREQLPDAKNQTTLSKLLSKPNMDLTHGLAELEQRQASIKKSREAKTIAKLLKDDALEPKQPCLKRKSNRGARRGPNSMSWCHRAFTEFFLPGRRDCNRQSFATGSNAVNVAVSLGSALELNIKSPPTEAECDNLPLCHFNNDDIEAVTKLATKFRPQATCGDAIPLIPPNSMNVGAMKSMLLHKNKLREMANKQSIFYYVDDDQLHKLGSNEKDALSRIRAAREQESCKVEEVVDSPPKKKRRIAASVAENVTKSLVTEGLGSLRRDQREEFIRPSPEMLRKLQENPHPRTFRKLKIDGESIEDVKAREDKLLFHRMVSAFFWPALLTERRPNQSLCETSKDIFEDLVKESRSGIVVDETDENVPMPEIKPRKWGGKYGELDIEEQQEIIENMEAKLSKRWINLRKTKRKNKMDDFVVPEEVQLSTPRWKQQIIKLKRSMIVKKTWEERRKGLQPMPNRKKEKVQPKKGERQSQRTRTPKVEDC